MEKIIVVAVVIVLGFCSAMAYADGPKKYICKYCGRQASSASSLTSSACPRHPNGPGKGRHAPYEGSEKSEYVCKYCGKKFYSVASMTANPCPRHPNGAGKGRHEPML